MSDRKMAGNSENSFKNRLERELEGVAFSEACRKKVLQEAQKPQSRLRALMDREILIPVKPVAAVLLITIAGLIYTFSGPLAVSSKDIEKSKIVMVENPNGGQKTHVYKN